MEPLEAGKDSRDPPLGSSGEHGTDDTLTLESWPLEHKTVPSCLLSLSVWGGLLWESQEGTTGRDEPRGSQALNSSLSSPSRLGGPWLLLSEQSFNNFPFYLRVQEGKWYEPEPSCLLGPGWDFSLLLLKLSFVLNLIPSKSATCSLQAQGVWASSSLHWRWLFLRCSSPRVGEASMTRKEIEVEIRKKSNRESAEGPGKCERGQF